MDLLPDLVSGLATGLSLIVAIGAQNAFVLRQGLLRAHVGTVVVLCTLSDAVLIGAGVAGIGVLVERAGWLLETVRWLGVAFLAAYGLMSLWRARSPQALAAAAARTTDLRRVVATTLALTWLNPHVYLDTVVLLGSVANQHGAGGRWWFALGAAAGSATWFTVIGYGARRAHRLLGSPAAWRVLDGLIGVVMLVLAARLALG